MILNLILQTFSATKALMSSTSKVNKFNPSCDVRRASLDRVESNSFLVSTSCVRGDFAPEPELDWEELLSTSSFADFESLIMSKVRFGNFFFFVFFSSFFDQLHTTKTKQSLHNKQQWFIWFKRRDNASDDDDATTAPSRTSTGSNRTTHRT